MILYFALSLFITNHVFTIRWINISPSCKSRNFVPPSRNSTKIFSLFLFNICKYYNLARHWLSRFWRMFYLTFRIFIDSWQHFLGWIYRKLITRIFFCRTLVQIHHVSLLTGDNWLRADTGPVTQFAPRAVALHRVEPRQCEITGFISMNKWLIQFCYLF